MIGTESVKWKEQVVLYLLKIRASSGLRTPSCGLFLVRGKEEPGMGMELIRHASSHTEHTSAMCMKKRDAL